jgi:hypothetical protein
MGSGSLGDFIHQLSVVQETFLNTGKKGRVYLSNQGYPFGFGLERAFTDLKDVVESQSYVESFHLHAGEPVDIDLSSWRQSPLLYASNWRTIFENTFRVSWALHKWLTLPESEYGDVIVIGMSLRRVPPIDWGFLDRLPGPALFVTDRQDEIDHWRSVSGSDLPAAVLPNLYELHRVIHGSRIFVGNLSSPLAVAMAAHRPSVGLRSHSVDDVHLTGLEGACPFFRLADREPIREIESLLQNT